jgi:hypothetical protein
MGARQTNRTPRGAQAEAKRRLADNIARAESALADFLEASEQIDYARQLIASYEGQQQRALAVLIEAVGREQAADLTGVDDRQVRAALAQARTTEPQAAEESDETDAHVEPAPPTLAEKEPAAQAS